MHSAGRVALLDNGVIMALGGLFNDSQLIVRKLVHKTLQQTSELWFGAEAIINANLVPMLFAKVQEEPDELKVIYYDIAWLCHLID